MVQVNNELKYSQFVISLGRLYRYQKIDKKRLDKMLTDKKINQEEYNYVISQL